MSRAEMKDADREEVKHFTERYWHAPFVMSTGRKFYPHQEHGFIERRDGEIVGLLTYRIEGDVMQLLTLNSLLEGQGIGSSLLLSAIEAARESGCREVTLITTNDALRAIGLYQRLGFRMVAVNVGVVDEARKIKPEIPLVGERGIPIHDEVAMRLTIKPYIDNDK